MAFFLKKSTLKGRTYLSIVESYYSPQKHGGAHRTYKSLASVETWKAKGIDDPIAYFQKEVDELNKNNKNNNSSSKNNKNNSSKNNKNNKNNRNNKNNKNSGNKSGSSQTNRRGHR